MFFAALHPLLGFQLNRRSVLAAVPFRVRMTMLMMVMVSTTVMMVMMMMKTTFAMGVNSKNDIVQYFVQCLYGITSCCVAVNNV